MKETLVTVLLCLLCIICIIDLIYTYKINVVKFAKIRRGAKLPNKLKENGCYDLFACFEEDEVKIGAHEVVLIPTGICSAFDKHYMAHVRERGSNTKSNLKVSAGVIDSGYRGEWFVALYNGNKYPVIISKLVNDYTKEKSVLYVPYEKAIAQFALETVPNPDIKYTSVDDIMAIKSKRGTGKLGSTDKK